MFVVGDVPNVDTYSSKRIMCFSLSDVVAYYTMFISFFHLNNTHSGELDLNCNTLGTLHTLEANQWRNK